MSDILSEIVADFLSRVPARSLLRFRCVSKSWREIIDSRDFIKLHLNHTIQTSSDRKLILSFRSLHMADFDALENTNLADYMVLDHPLKHPGKGTRILGSCNGLVCLRNSEEEMVLWNPTTRKHFKLPFSAFEIPKSAYGYGYGYGFGYDKVNDDYKVLRILQFYNSESENQVEVFSMKSNCWRKMSSFPNLLKYKNLDAVLAGGALHWLVKTDLDVEIAAFDLGTEEYRLLPVPDDLKKEYNIELVVLGDSLCLRCTYISRRFDIWVMKEFAVKESWTKLLTVTESDLETKHFDDGTPVAYSRSGHQVFMVLHKTQLLWYDLKKRKIRGSMYSSDGTSSPFNDLMEYHMCFGSLVQLDCGVSDSVGRVLDRKNQGSKKKSKQKRDDFLSAGFKLVL